MDTSLVLSGILDFSDNLAKSYGGAIYVKNNKDCSLDVTCSISVYGEKELVIFNNNSAEVGPSFMEVELTSAPQMIKNIFFIPGFCSC